MDEEPDDTNPMVFALVFLGGMVALGVGVYGFFFLMSIWPEL